MTFHSLTGPSVLRSCIAALLVSLAWAHAATPIDELLTRAGNADGTERLELLREARRSPEVKGAFAEELDTAIHLVNLWEDGAELLPENRPGEKAYLLFFDGKEEILAPLRDGSPLRPLFAHYRARMLIALQMENGWRNQERSAQRKKDIFGWLREARAAYPENRSVRMFLGEPERWRLSLPSPGDAPEWATLQREYLERLTQVIRWWITHRQLADGQFGGLWGDDCEMWRWWTPVLLGFVDPVVNAGQEKFSRGILSAPHMTGGYLNRVRDVQHSAEDSADSITPMIHLHPNDPEWSARSLRLIELMQTVWAGRNEQGGFQFRSTHLGSEKILEGRTYGFDSGLHARIVQPSLLMWQRTGHPTLTKVLGEWLRTWVDVAVRSDRGKPAGIFPSALQWPEGLPGIEGQWWGAQPDNPESGAYVWPASVNIMFDSLLTAWNATGDSYYLRPLEMSAALRLRYLEERPEIGPAGSASWAAANAEYASDLIGAIRKYRMLTGDTRFDQLLERESSDGIASRPDESRWLEYLQRQIGTWRLDFDGFTREVRFTDRVLEIPGRWMQTSGVDPKREPAETGLLYQMVTGDIGSGRYFPLNAVRWLTEPKDIAAWVRHGDLRRFEAALYHFGSEPRTFEAELYLLNPGKYRARLLSDEGRIISSFPVDVTGRGTRIPVSLPGGQVCRLTIDPE